MQQHAVQWGGVFKQQLMNISVEADPESLSQRIVYKNRFENIGDLMQMFFMSATCFIEPPWILYKLVLLCLNMAKK